MARWGITLPLIGVPVLEHRALVSELAGLGYTDVWSAETTGTDAFTPLALAAQWSSDAALRPGDRARSTRAARRRWR